MAEDRVQRRLAAILAADVVGYSRLMERDEAATFAVLKDRRKRVLEPLVARHQGRVFKVAGDSVLVQFGSAVNAVQCAIDLQQEMAAASADLPQESRIVLRIGINLGDVMVEGSDLYGDGVNIAARLEQMADPGGILISGTAYDQVKNKIAAGFDDLGTQNLKNIQEPVRIYRVAGTPRVSVAAPKIAAERLSIAVLPFTNMGGDPEQQYFSDGITEDIITALSRFHSLFVIARNSSFQYRDQAVDAKRIGRELGVQSIVEGSVRRSSNRVRVAAQLVEAATGNHLWADRYDRDMQDIFVVQDDVAHAIAATIEGRMAASGAQRSRRKPTNDLAAYDYFLQGRECVDRRDDPEVSMGLLRKAIELDPEFAQAYAWLSHAYLVRFHLDLRADALHEGMAQAQKALALDESDAWGHRSVGFAYMFASQHDLAGLHLERAVALNPTDVRITLARALWLTYMGRGDEAVRSLDADLRHDPFPPGLFWSTRGTALFQVHRYEDAIQALRHLQKSYRWDFYYLAAAHVYLGQIDKARTFAAEILRMRPGFVLGDVGITETFKDPADLDHLLDGLRRAGLSE